MALPTQSGRARKMMSRFPAFMRLENPGKALSHICDVLGLDLDDLERQLMRIQRAHRIQYAPESQDVLQLGSLMGLQSADFVILRKLYDSGFYLPHPATDDAESDIREAYKRYVRSMADRVTRIAALFLEGCGTVWALLEGTAVLLNADTENSDKPNRIEVVDTHPLFGGFVHRTPIRFKTHDEDGWKETLDYVYVVENPIVEKTSGVIPCWQRAKIKVNRAGFYHGKVTASITGVSDRTVRPVLINLDIQEGIGYNGVLPAGAVLQFTQDGIATVDGLDVTKDCYFFKGALADGPTGIQPEGEGDYKQTFVTSTPMGAMHRGFPRPVITPLDEIPVVRLNLGHSVWRFSVEEGAYDASAFDESVFKFPDTESARKALEPSGDVELVWNEHTPFAVTVLIPRSFQSYESLLLEGQNLLNIIRDGLERFRAAGIELNVQYFDTEWLLGKSLLEDESELDGMGVTIEGTAVS